jgi:hypothetical protein
VHNVETPVIRYDAQYIDPDIGIADDIIGKDHIADNAVALIAQTDGTAGGGNLAVGYMDALTIITFADQIDIALECYGIIAAVKITVIDPYITGTIYIQTISIGPAPVVDNAYAVKPEFLTPQRPYCISR